MIKLTIGICTYNRKEIIELTSTSLYEVKNIDKVNIKVFDDCSNDYNNKFLKEKYPTAKIYNNKKNLGADNNTQKMYIDFLKSDDEYLFNADSDLVFNTNVLNIIQRNITKLKKLNKPIIFSLFNEKNHLVIKNFNNELCIKQSLGAAGVIFSKDVIKKFINSIPVNYSTDTPSIDHFFSAYLRKNKVELLCTKDSYVQHIGIIGQNSDFLNFDYGINYKIDSISNAEAIINVLENKYMLDKKNLEEKLKEISFRERLGIKFGLKILYICIKNKMHRLFKRK